MKRLRVTIGGGRGYDILVGYHTLSRIGRHLKELGLHGGVFIITSPTIAGFHLNALLRGLRRGGFKDLSVQRLPDGEQYKTFASYQKLTKRLARFAGNEKDVFVVNLGGGVVGDAGGFVAATFRRGTPYVQVPTTLLAFVDCGIGGKVGVNLGGVKNLIGAFHQPRLVFADLALLRTLSGREMRSALAEVVKYGVILSPGLFEDVEAHLDEIFALDREVIERVCLTCYRMKAEIVRRDERDTKGIRAMLNYGHTIGHAVESASRYAYRHGEAISIGMACVNDLAVRRGWLRKSAAARIENLLIRIGLPTRIKDLRLADIERFFWQDKKFVRGVNRFVVPVRIGRTRLESNVPMRLVRDVLAGRTLRAG